MLFMHRTNLLHTLFFIAQQIFFPSLVCCCYHCRYVSITFSFHSLLLNCFNLFYSPFSAKWQNMEMFTMAVSFFIISSVRDRRYFGGLICVYYVFVCCCCCFFLFACQFFFLTRMSMCVCVWVCRVASLMSS